MFSVPSWPKPYSWQYLGISLAVAILGGIRAGLVALVVATLAVLWLGVPTPVHPGVEMFAAIDLALLGLLARWRRAQHQLGDALRDANARLADVDRRKDEFIAILSHELRNPLAPIRYALPLLQREHLGESAAAAVAVIARQTDHLARLVDDLLDVSRITRGKIELRRQSVVLDSILRAASEAASPAILAAGHSFRLVVPDQPIWLHADPARVAQVVTNLLNNSAKYTPRGGEITLEASRDAGQAVIAVRDNGIGIPEEALATMFEMFRQVERRKRPRSEVPGLPPPDFGPRTPDSGHPEGGLGIGLALARRLVEMHGGTIEARSGGVGRGAEFIVRLPLAAEPHEESSAHARGPSTTGGRHLKVLIVDDNVDLVDMLAILVSGLGHDVQTAFDGADALAAADAYRPDVVLLDLGLPVMGGLEVAHRLRQRPDTAKIRLVALTGWGQAEDRRETSEAGFDYHLTKPTDPRALEQLLEHFAASHV